MYLFDKKILIFGMGISGKGVAKLLSDNNISMVLYDADASADLEAVKAEIGLDPETKTITGELKEEDLAGIDVLALSPGISVDSALLFSER